MPFGLWSRVDPRKRVLSGAFLWERTCPDMRGDTLSWAVQYGWTDRHVVWVVNSGGSKEACVTWGHVGVTWRLRLNLVRRCGLMANYFDHWFFFWYSIYRTFALCYCFRIMSISVKRHFWFDSVSQLLKYRRRVKDTFTGNWRYFYHSILITCAENGHVMLRKHHYLFYIPANCSVTQFYDFEHSDKSTSS